MIIIDENFPESQRQLLLSWRIHIRQIGIELGRKGLQDDEIIPLLLTYKNPTFFPWILIFIIGNFAIRNIV